jgi:triacylglycerol lipase
VEGPNDGIVSVASARWGERTDLWEGDHLNLINCRNPSAERLGLWTDRRFLYGGLVRRLADLRL